MSSTSGIRFLNHLARLYGLQAAYYDANHRRQQASPESLLAILQSLGAPLVSTQDIQPAWRKRRQELWQQPLEPVSTLWDDEPSLIRLRLPSDIAENTLKYHLKLETGEEYSWEWHTTDIPVAETAEVEGTRYVVKHLPLSERLPWGYHKLGLELPGRYEESLIISAPRRAYLPPEEVSDRHWGVFLPLYALHRQKSWGSGDFSDLEELINWVSGVGGQVVATLPLLATFTDSDGEFSPYMPVSRLMWNEFYLDPNRVPELQECPSVQTLLESPPFQNEIKALRSLSLVDYKRQMALKQEALKELCRFLFAGASGRLEELHRFAEMNPAVDDYARFRATVEKQGAPWRSWPERLKEGDLKSTDFDEENRRYHLYVQWLAHQQMDSVSEKAKEKGIRLYLDLPVGIHPDGYDMWREREVFIPGASVGAPPDSFYARGQNWGSPPLHPERIREWGYQYLIAYLRHHLRHAGILRIDHVMGLHRLFCIPDGMGAIQGVYLHYRADELYAILALESHRHKAVIVGEDLGTVPPYVRPSMNKHGFYRMYVLPYELASIRAQGLSPVPRNSVVSLNTHDMYPFSAFWTGLDIKERQGLGLLDDQSARQERKARRDILKILSTFLSRKGWLQESSDDTYSALEACLSFLANSRSQVMLINLENLWLETQPQNVPSTKREHPNWQRKTLHSFEEFCQMPRVVDTLQNIDRLRRRGVPGK
ncbi:4-alpha-glucanotransferase [Chloroflexota bacterium]